MRQFRAETDQPLPGGTSIDLQTNTVNNLWGGQIGIEFAVLVSSRWWFNLDVKGGIYNDQISLTSQATQNGATSLITDTRNRTAWVGDISLVGNWQMTPYWVLRAGYQALFINGIGLAQDQALSVQFNNSTGPLNDSGRLAIHGPILGVMAGSVTLVGGPATGLAFAPVFEQAGLRGAGPLALTAATAGMPPFCR